MTQPQTMTNNPRLLFGLVTHAVESRFLFSFLVFYLKSLRKKELFKKKNAAAANNIEENYHGVWKIHTLTFINTFIIPMKCVLKDCGIKQRDSLILRHFVGVFVLDVIKCSLGLNVAIKSKLRIKRTSNSLLKIYYARYTSYLYMYNYGN